MMMRQTCAFFIAGMVAFACNIASAQEQAAKLMVLSIKVVEKTADSDALKILAQPVITMPVGEPFSLRAGSQVKPKSGGEALSFGMDVTGTLEEGRTGAVQLSVKIALGALVSQEDEPDTDVVRTDVFEIRTILQPGELKRIKCSATEWCEVRVTPAQSP